MTRQITITILLIFSTWLHSQSALQLDGGVLEAFSSEKENFSGILARPKFAPHPSQVFSFERQVQGLTYLYIYDVGARNLTEVQTVLREAGVKVSLEDSILLSQVNNSQLDWRPVQDVQRRQWFAFVSNSTSKNQDIFLGFAGGTTYIRLTLDTANDYSPKWSPDGNSIAFISKRSGNGDIYLIEEVDKIISDLNRNADNFKLRRLMDTPAEEAQLSWNPDPNSHLIAFAQKANYPGRQVSTYQIRVLDLTLATDNVTKVTDDPLSQYTRPSWDNHTASKLLYVGQELTGDRVANLYISELAWDENGRLKNKVFEGDKTEIFNNVHLTGTPALWLDGGEAVMAQENRSEQNYPIYSINVDRRLNKQERSVYYFGVLHGAYPYILDYDVRKNNLIFVNQEGLHFKIYLTKIYGDDINTTALTEYALINPRTYTPMAAESDVATDPDPVPVVTGAAATAVAAGSAVSGTTSDNTNDTPPVTTAPSSSGSKVWWAVGAIAAAGGVAAIILTQSENAAAQSAPIGRPPSLPNSGSQ